MTDAVEAARKARADAESHLREIERERDAAINAAKSKITEEYRERVHAASNAYNAAARAQREIENAAVQPHEWEGKTVVAYTYPRDRWTGKKYENGKPTVRRGVVFTRKHGDDLGPGNRRVPHGTPMIRLLKKDGTPGVKCLRLDRKPSGYEDEQWMLAE